MHLLGGRVQLIRFLSDKAQCVFSNLIEGLLDFAVEFLYEEVSIVLFESVSSCDFFLELFFTLFSEFLVCGFDEAVDECEFLGSFEVDFLEDVEEVRRVDIESGYAFELCELVLGLDFLVFFLNSCVV